MFAAPTLALVFNKIGHGALYESQTTLPHCSRIAVRYIHRFKHRYRCRRTSFQHGRFRSRSQPLNIRHAASLDVLKESGD